MATEWGGGSLGELVDLQRGITYKSDLLGRPGPVLLGLASIQRNGGFRSDSLKTYGGESPRKLILHAGDMYVSLKDVTQAGDLVGAVARVPDEIREGRLTQDTVKLIFKREDVPRSFVYWLLRTPQYRSYCRARAIGTTNLSLTRGDFLALPVPSPSATQLSLVELFDAVESKIKLNLQMNVTLETIAQTTFKRWFVDFQFPSFDGELVNGLPKGWKVDQLINHLNVDRGLSYKGDGLASKGDGIPMHNLNSVYEGGGYKYEGIKFYSGDFKDRHVAKPRDIIVANTEQGHKYLLIGYPAVVPNLFGEQTIYSHHIYRVRPTSSSYVTPQFIYYLFLHPKMRDSIIGCTNGTTVNMLKIDGLQMPEFVLPSKAVVLEYSEYVENIWLRKESIYKENQTLIQLRDRLLPKLVSGKIRVTE